MSKVGSHIISLKKENHYILETTSQNKGVTDFQTSDKTIGSPVISV
jgi:hypothetical protein